MEKSESADSKLSELSRGLRAFWRSAGSVLVESAIRTVVEFSIGDAYVYDVDYLPDGEIEDPEQDILVSFDVVTFKDAAKITKEMKVVVDRLECMFGAKIEHSIFVSINQIKDIAEDNTDSK